MSSPGYASPMVDMQLKNRPGAAHGFKIDAESVNFFIKPQRKPERSLPSATGRMRLPDGTERYVTDERTLLEWTSRLGGTLIDPLKTTNVQNVRCMTTWVLQKPR